MWGMMSGYYGAAGWLWMTAAMLLFWGGVIAIVVWVIRAFARPSASPSGDSALEILRRRLASGEISQEEFEKTRKLLQA